MGRACGDVWHYCGSYVTHPLGRYPVVRSGTGDLTAGDSVCAKPAGHPDWHTNGRMWWKREPHMWQGQNFAPLGKEQ